MSPEMGIQETIGSEDPERDIYKQLYQMTNISKHLCRALQPLITLVETLINKPLIL